MTKNISDIEKCAKLMGLNIIKVHSEGLLVERGVFHLPFNPLTNKSDLMDLECALGIDIEWDNHEGRLEASYFGTQGEADDYAFAFGNYSQHPDKFTARAHAVVAVAVKIYDRREG